MISPPPTRWNGTLALKHFLLRLRQLRSDRKKNPRLLLLPFSPPSSFHARTREKFAKERHLPRRITRPKLVTSERLAFLLFYFSLPSPSTLGTVRNFSTVVFKNWGGYGEGKGRRGTEKLAFSDIIFEQHLKKFGVGAFALAPERRYAFPWSRKKRGPKTTASKKNQQTT